MLLVVAKSARMLAQMVVDAGVAPLVVDCFLDVDTQALARDAVRVDSLHEADLAPALALMHARYGQVDVVYGSGFESCPDGLALLAVTSRLLGNSFAVFEAVQDKRRFFALLDEMAITYPETVFELPESVDGWLVKPLRGEGGQGIYYQSARQNAISTDIYWQRHVTGESMSVLFVANAEDARVLGFNRQWCARADDRQGFLFGGVSNDAELSVQQRLQLGEWVRCLSKAYGLQGLNSLDFILHECQCYLLEINARIPASAQLYGKAVLVMHLQALNGELPDHALPEAALKRAYQVIYAQQPICIPQRISWPQWVLDLPKAGVNIGFGEPICSIIAASNSQSELRQTLVKHRQILENLLETGSSVCNTKPVSTN